MTKFIFMAENTLPKFNKYLVEDDLIFIPHPKHRFIDLTRRVSYQLTVLGLVRIEGKRKHWACRCDCGNLVAIDGDHLRKGSTKSCGCLRKAVSRANGMITATHGMSRTRVYQSWCSMIDRCKNPDLPRNRNYSGRGITVCDRWRRFENFYADMGNRPTPKHSIERKDTNGNYEPDNCKWALPVEQANNRRSNVFAEMYGERKTISEWCRCYGLNLRGEREKIYRRFKKGEPLESILGPQV